MCASGNMAKRMFVHMIDFAGGDNQETMDLQVKEIAGFVYNPITGRWLLSDDISVNYIAYGTKRKDLGDI